MNNKEILNAILDLSSRDLDTLDLTHNDSILNKLSCFALHFHSKSGVEHYRLLSKLTSFFSNEILYDIGSNNGCSALALSENSTNQVESYDIYHYEELKYVVKNNIKFYLKNVLEEPNFPNSTRFIMLDTDHDGRFENLFYGFLKEKNYKGFLFLDDIHLNKEMKEFWNLITEEKYDLTPTGHSTGSGLVLFE